MVVFTSSASALQKIDDLAGINQSYKAGYTLRSRSETFHETSVQEFIAEEEGRAVYEEEEAKRLEEDLWQYRRSIGGGTVFSTNAKALAHDPTSDLAYTVTPAVGMSRKSGGTSIDLDYTLTHTRNAQDEEVSSVSHAFFSKMGYNLDRLKLNFSDDFSPRSIFVKGERTELRADNSAQDSVFAFTNVFGAMLEHDLSPKTKAQFTYKNNLTYFPSRAGSVTANTQLSDMTHSYTPRIRYAVTSKTSIFGEYTREIKDFFKGGDFDSRSHVIQVGLQAPIWFRIKLSAAGGYFIREYQRFADPSTIGGIYTVAVARPLTRKITGSLFSSQSIGENLDAAASPSLKTTTTLFGYNLTYAITPHLSFQNSASANFLERGGSVTKVDPENSTRTLTRPNVSDSYIWGLGLTWRPRKFFSAFAGYDYQNLKAPFNSNESENHRFAVSASVNF